MMHERRGVALRYVARVCAIEGVALARSRHQAAGESRMNPGVHMESVFRCSMKERDKDMFEGADERGFERA